MRTNEQIKELLRTPKNRQLVKEATLHQYRVAFHSEWNDNNPYKRTFSEWAKSMIDSTKWKLFDKYFVTPHENIDFTGKVYEQYYKIFNARNSYFNYSFSNQNHTKEFNLYLSKIEDRLFWKTKGYEVLKNAHNSIIVLTGKDKEANYFLLDIANVHDVSNTEIIEYLIYKEDENTYVYLDNEQRVVIEKVNDTYTVKEDVLHQLNFTPCAWFWNTSLRKDNYILKEHPITSSLGSLDWLLFNEISANHSDLYSLYPIMTAYEGNCNYKDSAQNECKGGYIYGVKEGVEYTLLGEDRKPLECPICGTSKLTGAGTLITVDPPSADENIDLLEGVKFVHANPDNLRLIDEKLAARKENLYITLTGSAQQLTNEAVNERQILSVNSDKETILTNLAYMFSLAQKSANDMMANYMYDDYNGSDVNYGNKFYIYTTEDLFNIYSTGLEKGYSESLMQDIRMQIIETEDRENIKEFERKLILLLLEPLPYMPKAEISSNVQAGLISPTDAILQFYFMNFIGRFEVENGLLNDFEKTKDFKTRIANINKQLLTYAAEKTASKKEEANDTNSKDLPNSDT